MMRGIFEAFSNLIPRGQKKKIESLLNYAGVEEDVDLWLGGRMLTAIVFAILGTLIPQSISLAGVSIDILRDQAMLPYVSLVAALAAFILVVVVSYLHLYYVIEERRKRVEAILPDFLLLIAANLRAGMTPIAAFLESSRPEFGPLEDEVRIVASCSLGTESFVSVFSRLSERINSRILKRTLGLFTTGMVSGGHLARLLETSALDIRETQELRQELASSTRMYIIFVLFVVLIGVPLLLSISIQFLVKLITLKSQISQVSFGEGSYALLPSESSLAPEFVEGMTYVILIGTTFFVSILIGVINEGKLLYGVRYFLPLAAISAVDFIVCKGIVEGILSSLA